MPMIRKEIMLPLGNRLLEAPIKCRSFQPRSGYANQPRVAAPRGYSGVESDEGAQPQQGCVSNNKSPFTNHASALLGWERLSQPRWGCYCLGPLPRVAAKRGNRGLSFVTASRYDREYGLIRASLFMIRKRSHTLKLVSPTSSNNPDSLSCLDRDAPSNAQAGAA